MYGQNNTMDGIGKNTMKDYLTKAAKNSRAITEFKNEEDLQTALSMFADSFSGCAAGKLPIYVLIRTTELRFAAPSAHGLVFFFLLLID